MKVESFGDTSVTRFYQRQNNFIAARFVYIEEYSSLIRYPPIGRLWERQLELRPNGRSSHLLFPWVAGIREDISFIRTSVALACGRR